MDFQIANKPAGNKRVPGVGKIHIAEISTFLSIKSVFASPATQAEKVTIDGDHTFNGTEGFRRMYTTAEKTDLEASAIGEEDSKGRKVMAKCFFPGSLPEFEAFLLDDPDMIAIIEPFPCNGVDRFQLGTSCSPAKIAPDHVFKAGTVKEGVKGYEFNLVAYQPSLLFYPGAITEPTA